MHNNELKVIFLSFQHFPFIYYSLASSLSMPGPGKKDDSDERSDGHRKLYLGPPL